MVILLYKNSNESLSNKNVRIQYAYYQITHLYDCITTGLCRQYSSFKVKSAVGKRLFSNGKYNSLKYGPMRCYSQEDPLKIFPNISKHNYRFYMTPNQLKYLDQ